MDVGFAVSTKSLEVDTASFPFLLPSGWRWSCHLGPEVGGHMLKMPIDQIDPMLFPVTPASARRTTRAPTQPFLVPIRLSCRIMRLGTFCLRFLQPCCHWTMRSAQVLHGALFPQTCYCSYCLGSSSNPKRMLPQA